MKRILFVVGTRPEIIKTAPVIQELRKDKSIKVGVCLSGQHMSMVTQMLKDFDLELDYDLKIMRKNQTLVTLSKNLMPALENVYDEFKPDVVFVQGDTTTALVASFVAFYKKIKVAHIEAGLRTFDKYFPFPEEMNRTLIGKICDRHYPPTEAAKKNLLDEGVSLRNILITGNTCIDSLKYMAAKACPYINGTLKKLPKDKKVILLTAHRRENFGKSLENVFSAVKGIAKKHKDVLIIYPVHPNPNVKDAAVKMLSGINNVKLLPSLHYRDLVKIMSQSYLILTDSGGIQEEAPSLGKPVLVLRNKTERPEAVHAGSAKIVGTDRGKIVKNVDGLLKGGSMYNKMSVVRDVFGDGKASMRISKNIKSYITKG